MSEGYGRLDLTPLADSLASANAVATERDTLKARVAELEPYRDLCGDLAKALAGAAAVVRSAVSFERAAEDFLSESDYELHACLSEPSADIFVNGQDAIDAIAAALDRAKAMGVET